MAPVKVGFFGNCQFEALQRAFAHPTFADAIALVPIPAVHKIKADDHSRFIAAVQAVDILYLHYTSERHGLYSYENVAPLAGDKVRLVPNLESQAFTPQIGYFSEDRLLPGTDYVDYLVLSHYLAGRSPEDAAERYASAEVDPARCGALLQHDAQRYRELHGSGSVIFDYAPRLTSPASARLFWTFNHPVRSEIEWLINQIIAHLGQSRTIYLQAELLDGNRVPVLPSVAVALGLERTAEDDAFMVFGRRLSAAEYVKLQYQAFDGLGRNDLRTEALLSNWSRIAVPAS
jgi:hypothetical protein